MKFILPVLLLSLSLAACSKTPFESWQTQPNVGGEGQGGAMAVKPEPVKHHSK